MRAFVAFAFALALAACGSEIDAGGEDVDAGVDDDPLAVPAGPSDGSLDHIHREIFARRCSGQPGLCHHGQFEPNLSTPAMSYNYLVNRPSIEKTRDLRVRPGDPGTSVLIDKLRDRDVATMMPLGADPLDESEIQLIEDWIADGALRRPGAEPAPVLNNTPKAPEIAVYQGATRLDLAGPFTVSVGATLTFRHTVEDFETPDDQIPFALFLLGAPGGEEVVVGPGPTDSAAQTTYDPAGPQGAGDQLNYRFDWTVPATVDLRDPDTDVITPGVPASGMTLNLFAAYLDDQFSAADVMLGFTFRPGAMIIQ